MEISNKFKKTALRKVDLYAMNRKPEADRLWAESHPNGAKKSE